MKKRIVTAILAVLMLLSMTGLTGCLNIRGEENHYEDDYFMYKIINDRMTVIGLTELGKQQEVLVIPPEVAGHPVLRIGKKGTMLTPNYALESDKLIKIFIPRSVFYIIGGSISSEKLEYIVFGGDKPSTMPYMRPEIKRCYQETIYSKYSPEVSCIANIEFLLNYKEGLDDVFWLDIEPPESLVKKYYEGVYTPTREGYTFNDWYKEPQCINEWNFETDRTPAQVLDQKTGEPITQITKLYAKWVQN